MINNECWLKGKCNHIDCDKPFCMRRYKMNYLYEQSGLSFLQRQPIVLCVTCDDCILVNGKPLVDEQGNIKRPPEMQSFITLKEYSNNIVKFVENGNNLLIHSPTCGNGKTSWAIKMMQSYIDKIWFKCDLKCKVLFVNVPRFLLEIKRNIEEKSEYVAHIRENVLDCDLVVWDELGTKGLTSFEHENILSMINARLDSGKSNIYTSNLNYKELQESLGDRLYSRIVNMSFDVELFGPDMRKFAMNEKLQENKDK